MRKGSKSSKKRQHGYLLFSQQNMASPPICKVMKPKKNGPEKETKLKYRDHCKNKKIWQDLF